MKKRFSEEQIIGFLAEAEDGVLSHQELFARRARVSHEASYYLMAEQVLTAMSVPDAKRLKELEAENGRLEKAGSQSRYLNWRSLARR